jgi:prepilin signal peptidase PulO-like enzyme (type II secretory pathway)
MARLRGQELEEIAFGFGDVTLSGLIGLIVGWPGVILALFSGIMIGGIFSLGYLLIMIVRRRYTAFMPIPYSPFLVIGTGLVYFGGRDFFLNLFGG